MKCCEENCETKFHALCGYLEGCEVFLQESNENKEDKTRNGFETRIRCLEHSTDNEVHLLIRSHNPNRETH